MRTTHAAFAGACLCLLLGNFPTIVTSADMLTVSAGRSLTADDDTGPAPSCRSIWTGMIEATITDDCRWGSGGIDCQCGSPRCPSFVTPQGGGNEYLYSGSVWFGHMRDGQPYVSTGADGWYIHVNEFSPVAGITDFVSISDRAVWTIAADTLPVVNPYDCGCPHVPAGIRVTRRAYAWEGAPENNIIIYDVTITNIGDEIINDGYIGFYMDPDAGDTSVYSAWEDDIVGSLPGEGIAYVIDNDGDPLKDSCFVDASVTKTYAFRFLTSSFDAANPSFNWWASFAQEFAGWFDFGPRRIDSLGHPICDFDDSPVEHSGIPLGDGNKYCLLSNGEWDYDQVRMIDSAAGWEAPGWEVIPAMAGADVRFLMSLGPIELRPDSSARVLFAALTGDSVHTKPDNLNNIGDPDSYLANLDFTHVVANAHRADDLADMLLDPQLPVTGVFVQHDDRDSVVIEWDPWVFDAVDGYAVYLYAVPNDSLPYPGVLPPWLEPDLASLDPAAVTGRTYHHAFASLAVHHFYFAGVAHRSGGAIGGIGAPVLIQPAGPIPAPEAARYAFFPPGEPVSIAWTPPSGVTVDHYNVYRFDNPEAAAGKYRAFYDTGEFAETAAPRDSFFVDGQWYYYYAMVPHAQVGPEVHVFSEMTDDSVVCVITAVDTDGYESAFSVDVLVLTVPPRTRDVVVLTSTPVRSELIEFDSVLSFYEAVLDGYDYDIYNLRDSLKVYSYDEDYWDSWWQDLMPFRLVIFEDGLRNSDWHPFTDFILDGLEKYILSGTPLAYFGCWGPITGYGNNTEPGYYPVVDPLINSYFGVDSVFLVGLLYYLADPGLPPAPDTLVGFAGAEATADTIPSLWYDRDRYSFNQVCRLLWDTLSPPGAVTFITNGTGETTHRLRSRYPETSLVEGHSVGVKTAGADFTTYVFGFHLWYMVPADGRALIGYMLQDTPTGAEGGESAALPDAYRLEQNCPNPFNPATRIHFVLPARSRVRIDVFNILGQRVRTLMDGPLEAGRHQVEWDGRDSGRREVASGIYFYRLQAGDFTDARKMILLR